MVSGRVKAAAHSGTSGPLVLARFIAGLGEAAVAETPELCRRVLEIARGSMAVHEAATLNNRPARDKRPTG